MKAPISLLGLSDGIRLVRGMRSRVRDRNKMSAPWFGCAILLFGLCVSDAGSLDCDDPSVVIECLYDPNAGESCGLRLEQSFRLFNVTDYAVIKIFEWLDEKVIQEEAAAARELQSYLRNIIQTTSAPYDSVAYVMYICRFRPFSCTRASRYRRNPYANETARSSVSAMGSVQEFMRARWALICYKMVWLERQSVPKPTLWRNASTETFHCMLRSPVPWKYSMEISSRNLAPIIGTATQNNNLTIYEASIKARVREEMFVLRCAVRFRTGTVQATYLGEYEWVPVKHPYMPLFIFCFLMSTIACVITIVSDCK